MLPIIARALAVLALLAAFAVPAMAQSGKSADDASPRVRLLLDLLADPEVRTWLEKRAADKPKPPPPAADASLSSVMTDQLGHARDHIRRLVTAAPGLPAELGKVAEILRLEFEKHGVLPLLLLIGTFIALGYGAEWLFWWRSKGLRAWITALPMDSVRARLGAMLARLGFGLSWVASFGAGSVGAFLAFEWPPLLREIVLGYLMAFLITRIAVVTGRFLLAPGAERFRILPMDTPTAAFWHRRLIVFVGWTAFVAVTLSLLKTLGLSSEARRLIGAVTALVHVAIALEAIWRRPGGDPAHHRRHAVVTWGLTFFVVALWVLRVGDAMPVFRTLLLLVLTPLVMRGVSHAVVHLLRPAGTERATGEIPGVAAVVLERGLRVLIVIGAVALLARSWGVSMDDFTTGHSTWTRLVHGLVNAVVIALVADLLWHVLRAIIDRRLAESRIVGDALDEEEQRRRARLNTLLPIFRNILGILVFAVAIMMALSALGVEIGPLIAGAGVVGVALGFGAQTLVRDIISGMFFLLDDAFRIGEYIQAGTYKGTVESFSLRSIKLRHHRGTLYTVPFGVLGAVQNGSRDWVIDKMTIGITYDSDIDAAKKIIKRIGKELAEIPDFKPHILQPLKMQGVEKFSDSAIEIRLKMMTKPGEQFSIRRRAYAMIKKAFDEAGIKFARPMAMLAEGAGTDPAAAAVARQAVAATAAPAT